MRGEFPAGRLFRFMASPSSSRQGCFLCLEYGNGNTRRWTLVNRKLRSNGGWHQR
jgi:hypothetical protein